MKENRIDGVSIIMPTYNQGAFIARAIRSAQLQTFSNWELIIVNDGSTDYTNEIIQDFLSDERIRYISYTPNAGLGKAINTGLDAAMYSWIAYLPSDDIWFSDHLQSLHNTINSGHHEMAWSGMWHSGADNTFSHGHANTLFTARNMFQLVQVLHRKTPARWLERDTLVTDDLNRMYWDSIGLEKNGMATLKITCEWVAHPHQRNKLIRENAMGGIHTYKRHYGVTAPLRYHSTVGNLIDEPEMYKQFRDTPKGPESRKGLKILLVGELAYNAERICALEEYGHQLYGLWIPGPEFYNTVGPLPFGNIEDIPLDSMEERIAAIKPDIIYALLNYGAIPLAHHVMLRKTGIPFVWHFKEGPFFARQYGMWKELIELYANADGAIFINEQVKDWYAQFITFESPTFIMDGDLPKKDWFISEAVERLSQKDGEIHTVMPGRPFGIDPNSLKSMADQKIHLHFYGEYFHNVWKEWAITAQEVAPNHIHFHSHCDPAQWAAEFGRYDAGWLHTFDSFNGGELIKCSWNDLNYPARMNTLAAAGLPMIQKRNEGHMVAIQSYMQQLDVGYFYDNMDSLANCFQDQQRCEQVRKNIWNHRHLFSFDFHVKALTDFFHEVIEHYHSSNNTSSHGKAL